MTRKKARAAGRSIGDQLRDVIVGRGLTAYAVGKDSGVNTSMVQRFLDGERDLRLETAGRIAEALGLRLVEVGSRKGKPAGREKVQAAGRPAPDVEGPTGDG